MREFSSTNDEAVFDRRVDGELPADDRRALLESLDSRSDGWRRCAIAFLDAQSWGNEFRQLVRESDLSKKAVASPAVEIATNRSAMRRAVTWVAIAASLLTAFSLGVMRRNSENMMAKAPADSQKTEQIAVATPSLDSPEAENDSDPDALTFWVLDDAGQARSIRVPLMDAVALDRELGVEFQPGIPANVRSRLQDRGYHVQSKRRYAPLWLENGQRMVFPVEDTKIVPVSQNVY
jgi:hypothetical protein